MGNCEPGVQASGIFCTPSTIAEASRNMDASTSREPLDAPDALQRMSGVEPQRAHSGSELEPLVIDLDGVLMRPNMLAEHALAYIRHHPLRILQVLFWLLKGRSVLKWELARRVPPDAMVLPLSMAMEAYAAGEKAKGRKIYLAAAGSDPVARSVVDRCGFFDGVLADRGVGSVARSRHKAVGEVFDPGLAYAGGSHAGVSISSCASSLGLGGPSAKRLSEDPLRLRRPSWLGALIECARPHQWAKNLLVFVPAILSGEVANEGSLVAVSLAFLALCIVASSTYILNDLWDVSDDRRHWSKRKRPIASGRLPLTTALAAAPAGLALGMLLGASVAPVVTLVLSCYLVLTFMYSFVIKRIPILDVSTLAGLFTIRLVLGIVSAGVFASPWLLVFSMFLFASLCFAKRYVELERSSKRGETSLAHRGYQREDSALLLVLGLSTGIASIVVLVLYIIFDAFRQTFYGNTIWLWAFPIILFLWTSRIWLVAVRGTLDDDPVAFAVKDKPSILLGTAMLGAFLLAWSGAFA